MPKKITTKDFIKRSNIVHNNFYDYSETNYISSMSKIEIICPIHGKFHQLASGHLRGKGCLECSGNNISTTEDFIVKANIIHNNKYDYSLLDYKNAQTKVKIICPIHGIFKQKPNSHLNGKGCLECSGNKPLTLEDFIEKGNFIHKNKYDYSLLNVFKGTRYKVEIICPEHGKFLQQAGAHLHSKNGCPNCHKTWSKGEKEIVEYIKSIYSGIILENDRTIISPKELDIYLPEINLAIEYNGEYWHRLYEERNPGYHKRKALICEQKEITLINILDSQWETNKNIIKNFIEYNINNEKQRTKY